MKPQTAIIKIKTRLNKLDSFDYDNIEDWVIVEAVNKAALEICRGIIQGKIQGLDDGAEESSSRISDIQCLLKTESVEGNNQNTLYFESKLPKDFLWHNSLVVYASKENCKNKKIKSDLREQANVETLLQDHNSKPSFEWRETFHTYISNKFRVYTNNDFDVEKVEIIYYRKPIEMDIFGYVHEDGKESKNVDLEFKDDFAEVILDYAASIISGDIESINQSQITLQRSQMNK
jgi:hypothetical protein